MPAVEYVAKTEMCEVIVAVCVTGGDVAATATGSFLKSFETSADESGVVDEVTTVNDVACNVVLEV